MLYIIWKYQSDKKIKTSHHGLLASIGRRFKDIFVSYDASDFRMPSRTKTENDVVLLLDNLFLPM